MKKHLPNYKIFSKSITEESQIGFFFRLLFGESLSQIFKKFLFFLLFFVGVALGGWGQVPVTCNGANDGKIDINEILAGTPPYSYAWTGPNGFTSNIKDISGLAPGDYTITITDSTPTVLFTKSFTITEPALLTAAASGNPILCNGGTTTINIVVNGGTTPYSNDNPKIVGVGGPYTYTITDSKGCQAITNPLSFTEPSLLTATAVLTTPIKCFGGTATVTVSGNGGTPLYSNTGVFNPTVNSSLNYTITDANGCQATSNTINNGEPAIVFSSGTQVNVSCFGGNNGSIDLTVTGGSNSYTYAWSGPSGFSASAADIGSLKAGTYTVVITESNNCTITGSTSFTITEPALLTAAASGNPILCNGGTTTINIVVNGGTTPYSNDNPKIVGVGGPYTYTITDSKGCQAITNPLSFTEPSLLTATAVLTTPIKCFGGTATVTVSGNGGTPLYSNTGVFNPTVNSSLNYTITDANGCQATSNTINNGEPAIVFSSGTQVNVSCFGGNNGSIDLTVTGGSNSYTYAWSGPSGFSASVADIGSLQAGTYTVVITESNNCTITGSTSFTITEPALLTAAASGNPILCNGGTTTINIVVNGGTTPYSNDNPKIVGVGGPYTYTITDSKGCQAITNPLSFTEPSLLTATAVLTTPIKCFGGTATVTVSGNGGTPLYSNTGVFNPTVNSSLNYTITDANGCQATSNTINNGEPAIVFSSGTQVNVSCFGGNNGSIDLTVTGGSNSYTYAWSGPSGFSASVADIGSLQAGTYTVVITESNNCTITGSTSFTITEPALLTAAASGNPILCNGGTTTINIVVNGGTTPYSNDNPKIVGVGGPYTYTITDSKGCQAITNPLSFTEPSLLTATAVLTTPIKCFGGTATVTVSGNGGTPLYSNTGVFNPTVNSSLNYTITDANGCQATSNTINNGEPALLTISADPTNVLCFGTSTGAIVVTALGGTEPYSYDWGGSITTKDRTGIPIGTYSVTVTDANMCTVVLPALMLVHTDADPPVFTCPTTPYIVSNELGKCDAVVTCYVPIANVNVTDNCTVVSVVRVDNGNLLVSGDRFPVGTTTVVYEATDSNGNKSICSFDVTVQDNELPKIACSALSVSTIANSNCYFKYDYVTPVGTDNCNGDGFPITELVNNPDGSIGLPSGSLFPAGLTTTTYRVTDKAGNIAVCSFTVDIKDETAPTIDCTAVDPIPTDGNTQFPCTSFVQTVMRITERCSVLNNNSITIITGSSSTIGEKIGEENGVQLFRISGRYPLGPTPVSFQITDAAGNVSLPCTFTINVFDAESPTVGPNRGDDVNCVVAGGAAELDPDLITDPKFISALNSDGKGKDNCQVTRTFVRRDADGYNGCSGPIIYIYKYSDGVIGHDEPIWTYTFNVVPSASTIDTPGTPDAQVECLSATNIRPTPPIFKDACGRISVLTDPNPPRIETLNPGSTCEGKVTYTYIYEDCSGTPFSWVYTYTVKRIHGPTQIGGLIATSDITCRNDVNDNTITPLPDVRDYCNNTLTYPANATRTINVIPSTSISCEKIEYNYVFTDCAGLTFPWKYTYNVVHTNPPTIKTAGSADKPIECADLAYPPHDPRSMLLMPRVEDQCGNVLETKDFPGQPPIDCEGKISYIYYYFDCTASIQPVVWTYTYTIAHTTPLTIPVTPNTATVECLADINPLNIVYPSVTDICGKPITPTVAPPVDSPTNITCSGTRTYTYTYTDCAGLSKTWQFIYTIQDTKKPDKPILADKTNSCSVTLTAPTTTDLCAITVTGTTTDPITYSTAGTYNVTWTFTDNCGNFETAIQKVIITPIVPDAGMDRSICLNATPITLSATPVGGTWAGDGILGNSFDPALTTVGPHTITYSYTDGTCITTDQLIITVNPVPNATITPSGPTTFCAGGNVTLNAPANSSYIWGPNGETTQGITVSSSGTYRVTVTNANSCTAVGQISVIVNPLPTAAVTGGGIVCANQSLPDVTVTLTGIGPWSITLSNGTMVSASSSPYVIAGANAGTYTVTALTDGNGCVGTTFTGSATVVVNPVPTATISNIVGVNCLNGNNGSVDITLGGGTAPYSISNGLTGLSAGVTTVSGLSANTYIYTITDNNSCTSTVPFTIPYNPPPPLTVSINNNSPITACAGYNPQEFDLVVSGGLPPLSYQWQLNGVNITGATLSTYDEGQILTPGIYNYSVIVTDKCGQSQASVLKVITIMPDPVSQDVNPSPDACVGASVSATFSGGSGGAGTIIDSYEYSINGGSWQPYTPGSPIITDASMIGTNIIRFRTIRTATFPSCNNATYHIGSVSVLPRPTVSVSPDVAICESGSTTLTAMGAVSYSWNTGQSTNQITVSPANTFTYIVTGTTNGCSNTASVKVDVNPILTPNFLPCDLTSNSVTFYWSSVSGALSYDVQIGSNPPVNVSGTTYLVNGLMPNSSVTITVTPIGGTGTCFNPATNNCTSLNCINPTANISYNSPFCSSSTSESVSLSGTGAYIGGLFSSTPSGLSINPTTGQINPNASTAGSYTVTYTIAASGGCSLVSASVGLVINAVVTPTFDPIATICSGASLAPLPTTSLNGFTGTWSPALSNTMAGTYTFTPDAGQCATTATLSINVTQPVTPTFAAVVTICSGASLSPLPTTSLNGFTGTWSPALSNTMAGTYTFTPDAGQCATTATLSINVTQPVTPTFAAVATICSGASLSPLPTTSLNGFTGTWSPALSNTMAGTYTFTPDAGQCATTATLSINVTQPVTPTFAAVATICSGASLSPLPTTSLNGFTGTWSPALSNTMAGTYTFTPDAGQCATTATLSINVTQPVTPTFAAVVTICSGASLSPLPTTSLNGFTGTWSPALSNTMAGTYTFTPTAGHCATTATLSINVTQPVTPTFDPIATICSGASLAPLPTTSLNGFTGTWSPALSNTMAGTYTFTPDAGQCATTATLSINVTQPVTPTFAAVATICSGASLAPLPTTSLNGFTGTWSPALSNTMAGTYTFTPDAGQCATTATLSINVTQPVTPTFAAVATICSGASLAPLPTTSLNGFTGTWSPALSNTMAGTYTFTPDAGQCATTATLSINVTQPVTPTFAAVATICSGASLSPLPTTSLNGFTGTWSPALSNTMAGTYTFTPDAGQCATTATLSINVTQPVTPTFAAVATICSGASLSPLPTTSLNGFTGTWSPALSNTMAGTYTFTPDAGQCATTATLSINVTQPVTPTFAAVATICSGASLSPLPTTSLNGFTGTWSPALSNTMAGTYTFTPDAGQCATTATLSINVTQPVTPTFAAVATICSGASLAPLPTTSLNGFTGTWSPALSNTMAGTYTFTPDAGQCATTATLSINVTQPVTPTFAAVATICSGASLSPLPTTSLNGFTGTWSPALSNTMAGTYTFTPDAGQCATTATLSINVTQPVTPTFAAVATICSGASLSPLPTTSLNGFTGTWSPALSNTMAGTYTFTPDAGQCATTTTLSINVTQPVTPTFAAVATICSGASLSPLPTTSLNGFTGTWSPALSNTMAGTYTFTPDAGQCATTATLSINVTQPVTPTFAAVATICSGASLSPLPTTSLNGFTGTWSPALSNTMAGTYTFTPDAGQCATTATLSINVTQPVTPTFAAVVTICSGASLSPLPTTSLNGFTGTWSPALSNTMAGTYTFTPDAGQCATTATLSINVTQPVTPTFAAVATICSGASLSPLPTTSLNGFTGTWSPALSNTMAGTYTFTPDAGQCATTATLSINVTQPVTPTFAAVATICSGASLSPLPTTSLNGFTGTWSPALSNTMAGTYTFTPDAGQCATTATLSINVTQPVTPTFAAVVTICSGASLSPLPTTSLNGFTGTWSPALSNTMAGTYTFTPTAGHCATTATLSINVTQPVTPTFDPIATICSGASLAPLPTTSLNGFTGTWSPALSNTMAGTYTFTPDAGQCATTATLSINVTQPVTPTFAAVATICSGASLAPLPTTSLNGFTGTWSPALSNTMAGTYTFTPDAGQCATTATLSINVTQPVTPTFAAVATICSGASLAPLPTTSLNGFTGTWSPALSNTMAGTYTFTPDAGQCATTATLSINVTQPVTPTFAAVATICSGASLSPLPTTSLNGFTGTWSPALSNTMAGTYTFTPDAGQCATTATLSINVTQPVTPTFAAVATICSGASLSPLPTTSLNGFTGTWSPALSNTMAGTYTFTPDAGQCATTATLSINVTQPVTPTFAAVATICSGASLSPLPTTSLNGFTGTWSPALSNTMAGTYTFTPDAGQCATTATLSINVTQPVTPTFAAVATICSGASLAPLPTTSLNGFTGTWSPALSNTMAGTYTFTPDAGQCATTATLSINVTQPVTPTFAAVATICSGASLSPLPTTSLNGFTGTWSPALSNTMAGTYTFTPDAGQCATTATLSINVTQPVTPTFAAVATICSGASLSPLPTTSLNGFTGTWSPALSNTMAGTYTFTPDAGQCATTTTLSINVTQPVTPTFAAVATICSGASLSPLPTTSLNGFTGTWSPALSNTMAGTYTFTPDAGQCATTATLSINVTQPVTPTFAAVATICSGASLSPLPTTSLNGFTGTWSPALSNTMAGTYTFTPDAGQCATTATLSINVTQPVTPTFAAVATICSGASLSPLPTTSLNGFTGTWSPALSNTMAGTYTFTPDAGQCATTATLSINVTQPVTPTFAAVVTICSGASLSPLPTTSLNGFTGTWSPALSNTMAGTYTFTPDAGQCATTATLSINVTQPVTPTFAAVATICSGASLAPLPTTSLNGFTGTWSPALSNTMAGTYTFTPDAGQCATTATLSINVTQPVTPTFAAVATICSGASLSPLPTTSLNGFTGTWSPALSNTMAGTYTFTPDAGQCATTATLSINVTQPVTPTFAAVATICSGASLAPLPTTSLNGFTGTWSPALSNTMAGTYTFTPDAGQCATTATLSINVTQPVTPTFAAVATICSGASLSPLPTTSLNGFTGTWSPALSNTMAGTYTFTPDAGQCATTATLSINVTQPVTPTFAAVATICSGASLSPLPTTSLNGFTGTWSPALSNTMAGTYTFTPTAGQCATTATLSINVTQPVTPTFAAVATICSGASLAPLPTTSLNGFTGTWSPALSNTMAGTYTFTPDAGQCATTATLSINVTQPVTPTFAAVATICSGASLSPLLTTSLNGFTGTWSPALSNTMAGTYTFTPDAGQCATTATLSINVTQPVTPTFAAVATICSGASLAPLPTTSLNGFTGTWSPALSNTMAGTYTFTPDAGQCATTATLSINVTQPVTPTFAAVATICSGASLSPLLTTSLNGFTGTWSPALSNTMAGTYTFTPDAGQCATTATLSINVTQPVTPTFAAVATICSGASLSPLPTTSLNGFTGTWSPALSNTMAGTYTFTPDAGQCATTATLSINVTQPVTPTFAAVATICSGASLSPLPTTSLNGFTGTWSPALSNTMAGTYTFTPTAGQCATTATLSINVTQPVTPTFAAVATICSGASLSPLPTTSLNGFTGTWSPALSNTMAGTYTFTPDAGQCATTATLSINVTQPVTPTFAAVATICSGASLSPLPTTSLNGFTGTWSPALSNTMAGTYTFTPDAGQCATTATLSINVTQPVTPTFAAVVTICSGASLSPLPTTSLNGFTGTWSPALSNTMAGTYTFTPDAGQCATTATLSINVTQPVTPTFAAVATICSGASLSPLPTTSLNGFTGTWSPALSNTMAGTYTFTPDAGQCATTATLSINVTQPVTPTFAAVATICSGASLSPLPTTSLNGFTGTWSPALSNTMAGTYTFTPDAGQCATTATLSINVTQPVTPTFAAVATICSGASLAPLPTTSLNGFTGTWSPALSNTMAGTYTFTPTASGTCVGTFSMTISINPNTTPTFIQVPPICTGAILAQLPATSINGISGTWSPAMNNLVTTTYTFTPAAGQCANTSTMEIVVKPKVTPTFTPVGAICQGSNLGALPTISLEGINGTWSAISTNNYLFTPNAGECANTATMVISEKVKDVPTFNPVLPVCEGSVLNPLPLISINGISGTWTPALNNLVTTEYTFTPNADQCAEPAKLKIEIKPKITPNFVPIADICIGATLATLPTTSINGIKGTWSPALNNMATTTYTFTPDDIKCANTASLTIVVKPKDTPTFTQIAPIGEGETLAALPTVSLNGIAGTWSPALNNLFTTTYTFTPNAGLCANPAQMTINVRSAGVISNPDFNVTLLNTLVTGNVNTNDYVTVNSIYSEPIAKMGNPNSNLPVVKADGSYTFVSDLAGVYTFTIKICDPLPSTYCTKELLFITVIDPESQTIPPVANVDLASTLANKSVIINSLSNDKPGFRRANLSPSSTSLFDLNGIASGVSFNGGSGIANLINGDISYSPPVNFVGTDTLRYTICDTQIPTKCATAYQVIRVLRANSPNSIYASDDYFKSEFNISITGNVKVNDYDPDGNNTIVTAQTVNVLNKGQLVLTADGNFKFTPVLGFTGPIEFVYTVCDDATPVAACFNATLHLLVMPPFIIPKPDFASTIVNVPVNGNVSTNDEVSPGTTYSNPTALVTNPTGTLPVLNPDGTYTFVSSVDGEFVFDIKICAPLPYILCKTEKLTITVFKPTNDNPPIAVRDAVTTPYETPITIATLANDSPGSYPLNISSVKITKPPKYGTATVDPTTGEITYIPNNGSEELDSLQYTVCDNQLMPKCASAYQVINVLPCIPRPTNLIITPVSATEIRIKYTDNSFNETGFEIQWSKDGIVWTQVGNKTSENTTTLIYNVGITPETKYYFRARAVGETCYSSFSNEASVTTNPPAPINLTAKGVKISEIDLAWTNTSKTATGIEIQSAVASGVTSDSSFVKIKNLNTVPYEDKVLDLRGSTKYRYRIRYTSPNGVSAWSNIADASTLTITANEAEIKPDQVLIYPVPTQSNLYLKPTISVLGKIQAKIYNEVGLEMLSHTFNGFVDGKVEQLNIESFKFGIYYLQISTKKGSFIKKIEKQ